MKISNKDRRNPKRIKNIDLAALRRKRDLSTKSRLPGCEGCTKDCRFNSAIADPNRFFPSELYKCNTKYSPEKEYSTPAMKSIIRGIVDRLTRRTQT